MRCLLSAAAAISVIGSPASAQDRVELAPASDWVLNYDDDSCALQRQFGEEGGQMFFELRKFGPGADMQVTVASSDFATRMGDFFVVAEPINLRPQQIEGLFNLQWDDDYKGRLFSYSLSADDQEYSSLYRNFIATTPILLDEQRGPLLQGQELWERAFSQEGTARERTWREFQRLALKDGYQAAHRRAERAFQQTDVYRDYFDRRADAFRGIGLYGAFDESIFLRTGSLDSAMAAMDTCLEELMGHWGIDVEAHRDLTRPVEPYDYERLVSEVMEDYPREMARRRLPAMLRVRLDVSEKGAPTGCHMQSGLSHEAFEEIACDNMMRFAQFYPALDAQGEPIASYFQTSIVYRIGR